MVSPHSRRVFLTYGVQTVAAVPTLLSSRWAHASDVPGFIQDATFKHLRAEDHKVLLVLMPIALGVKLDPQQSDDQKVLLLTLKALDQVMDSLSERKRKDLLLLLDFLAMPLTRTLLGIWSRWDGNSRTEVESFLDQWERSSLHFKRLGYQALVQLMEFAFYGTRLNTVPRIYPDVPASIRPFLQRFSAGEP